MHTPGGMNGGEDLQRFAGILRDDAGGAVARVRHTLAEMEGDGLMPNHGGALTIA